MNRYNLRCAYNLKYVVDSTCYIIGSKSTMYGDCVEWSAIYSLLGEDFASK